MPSMNHIRNSVFFCLILCLFALLLASCVSADTKSESSETKPDLDIQLISDNGFREVYKIIESSKRGYNVSAYLMIPKKVKYSHLFVWPKKSGDSKSIEAFDKDVLRAVKQGSGYLDIAEQLGATTLVPVLPQDEEHEYIRLSYYLNKAGKYKRLDLQVKALIEDSFEFLADKGIELSTIVLAGYSGEAQFCVHFSILHPEMVAAVAAGGVCCPILPETYAKWEDLPYPIGLKDFRSVSGKKFNFDAWKKIRFFLTTGRKDDRGINFKSEFKKMNSAWARSFESIWEVFSDEYVRLSPNAQMVMYKNLGHEPVHSDELLFLRENEYEFSQIDIKLPATVKTSK